jgi:hypothetical protein
MVSSVTSGFQNYAAAHPLSFLNLRNDFEMTGWEHRHVISEDESSGINRLDGELLHAYLAAKGSYSLVFNKTLPSGSIITAVVATSVFTVVMILAAFVAMLLAFVARLLSQLEPRFSIRKHPFVFMMAPAGLILSILHISLL